MLRGPRLTQGCSTEREEGRKLITCVLNFQHLLGIRSKFCTVAIFVIYFTEFYLLLTVQHLGIIFVNSQLDAQFFFMYVYFCSLHVSGSHVPIIRRINCINTYTRCIDTVNPLNAELNPICCLLALLGAHHFLHVGRIRVKSLTLRLLMSYIYICHIYMYVYIYIYGAPILDVSRSHTTTQHSR